MWKLTETLTETRMKNCCCRNRSRHSAESALRLRPQWGSWDHSDGFKAVRTRTNANNSTAIQEKFFSCNLLNTSNLITVTWDSVFISAQCALCRLIMYRCLPSTCRNLYPEYPTWLQLGRWYMHLVFLYICFHVVIWIIDFRSYIFVPLLFTARCYAERGYRDCMSSVRLSVRRSVTFRCRDHMGWNS